MISTNDLRNGISVELDGDIYTVVEFQHVKPGKGSAFVRTKLKNLKNGYVLEKTFRAGEKLPHAHIERRPMQYLYNSGDGIVFMNTKTYDQINLTEAQIGDNLKWLKEGTEVSILFYQDNPIGVDIPNFVELKITFTEPGFKGDTATGGNKPATLETGASVLVPLFVEIEDVVQIDTRTGTYLKRV